MPKNNWQITMTDFYRLMFYQNSSFYDPTKLQENWQYYHKLFLEPLLDYGTTTNQQVAMPKNNWQVTMTDFYRLMFYQNSSQSRLPTAVLSTPGCSYRKSKSILPRMRASPAAFGGPRKSPVIDLLHGNKPRVYFLRCSLASLRSNARTPPLSKSWH